MPSRFLTIAKYVTGIFLCFSIFTAVVFMVDPDLPWHRAVGGHILETGTLPHFDEYTNSMPGFPWVDHEWAIEVFLSFVYSHGLPGVAVLLFTALAAAPFLYWISRARGFLELWLVLLCALATFGSFGVRPQLVSVALFFLLFLLLEKRFTSPESLSRRQVFALEAGILVLFLVWANLHAGFPAGLVLLSTYLFSDAITHWKSGKLAQRIMRGGIFLSLAILIPLLNPYGVGLYKEIFTVMTSATTKAYIVEWQPWFKSTVDPDGQINYMDAGIFLNAFYVFFALSFFRKYPPRILVSSLVFLVLYHKSVRMAPLFIITLLPFFFFSAQYLREKLGERQLEDFFSRKNIHRRTAPKVALALGVFFFLFLISSTWNMLLKMQENGTKISLGAVSFLEEEYQHGEKIILWNDYSHGGTIIERAPGVKIFIDGRMPHWRYPNGDSAMQEYAVVAYSEDKRKIGYILEQRKINTMLFAKSMLSTKPKLQEYLGENQWKIVYEDDIAVVYQKSESK